MGAGAPSTLNYDPTAGQLPPQAPAPAPTPMDNVVQPAQSAQDILRPAAYGDKGAAQYNALATAGQPPAAVPAPPPPGGLAGLAGSSAPPAITGSDPLSNALIAFGGGDPYKRGIERAELARQQQEVRLAAQREQRENASEFYTQLAPAIFKQFPGRPDLAANVLANTAAARGLQVDQAYLLKLDQDYKDGTHTPAEVNAHIWDPNTDANTVMRLGPMADSLNKTLEASAMARTAAANAAYAPEFAKSKATAEAARAAMEIRQSQRPLSLDDLQTLKSGGYSAWAVPMPGVPGGMMTMTGLTSQIPAGVKPFDPADIEAQRAKAAGEQTRARTAAGPIPAPIIDKLANFDNALDIIGQLKKLYAKGSPTDQERQSWLNRVGQELKYTWGFDQPDNLDEDTALRSLGAITAGRAFVQGRPNQQLMQEIWKHTGQNPLVSPDQMRDRLGIMEHAVSTQRDRMKQYAQEGRSDLDTVTDAEGAATGQPAGGPAPTATPLSDWLNANP